MEQNRDRFRSALEFMNSLGLSPTVVTPLLKRLLKVYDNEWQLIEEENYRVLADSYFEQQESQSKDTAKAQHKGKEASRVSPRYVTRSTARSQEGNTRRVQGSDIPQTLPEMNASSSSSQNAFHLSLETISYRESEIKRGENQDVKKDVLSENEKRFLDAPLHSPCKKKKVEVSEPLSKIRVPPSSILKEKSSRKGDGGEQPLVSFHRDDAELRGGYDYSQDQLFACPANDRLPSASAKNQAALKQEMRSPSVRANPASHPNSVHQEALNPALCNANGFVSKNVIKKPKVEPEDDFLVIGERIPSSALHPPPTSRDGRLCTPSGSSTDVAGVLPPEKPIGPRSQKTDSEKVTSGYVRTAFKGSYLSKETESLFAIAQAYSGVSDESSEPIVESDIADTQYSNPGKRYDPQEKLVPADGSRQLKINVANHSRSNLSQIPDTRRVKVEYSNHLDPSHGEIKALRHEISNITVKKEPESQCRDPSSIKLCKGKLKRASFIDSAPSKCLEIVPYGAGNGSMIIVEPNQFVSMSVVEPNQLVPLNWDEKGRHGHDEDDISRGEEKIPIPVAQDSRSENLPITFFYISKSISYQNAYVNFSLARIGDENCCANCYGDCLRSPIPCACARETGGEYAYCIEGVLRYSFLQEALEDKRGQSKRIWYCEPGLCPLERGKNELNPEQCKGHLMRKFVKECWSKCGCSMHCGNRLVQRGISCKLEVFYTHEGKGWGVRTLQDLPVGSFVCEYAGEIITNVELDTRNKSTKGEVAHYPVLLDADWGSENVLKDEEALCLDATNYGNVARFINHRCYDANLLDIPVEIESPDHHYYHVAFFTTRFVRALEELTWDYCIDFEDHNHPIEAFRCRCGSSLCRGSRQNSS